MWHGTEPGSGGEHDAAVPVTRVLFPHRVRRITFLNSRPNALPASAAPQRSTDIALFYCEQNSGSWFMHYVCNRISLVEYRWHD